jgi:hypothetical protein
VPKQKCLGLRTAYRTEDGKIADNLIDTFGSFMWPEEGLAEAPADLARTPHSPLSFLREGAGDYRYLDDPDNPQVVFQIVEFYRSEAFQIGCTSCWIAPRVWVVHTGNLKSAADYLVAAGCSPTTVIGAHQEGGDDSFMVGAAFCTLKGGRESTLIGGHRATLEAGLGSCLIGGNESALRCKGFSRLFGGESSVLVGDNSSILYAGRNSKLTAGPDSVLVGGVGSELTWKIPSSSTGAKARTVSIFLDFTGRFGTPGQPYTVEKGKVVPAAMEYGNLNRQKLPSP